MLLLREYLKECAAHKKDQNEVLRCDIENVETGEVIFIGLIEYVQYSLIATDLVFISSEKDSNGVVTIKFKEELK